MFSLHSLKTSDKITFLFTIFNLISMIILLFSINVIYFFSWYTDQKEESMYDMNMNYNTYTTGPNIDNLAAFKEYILKKDTLIIPSDGGEIICSHGVEAKIHNDINSIKDNYFYDNGDRIFFIFSQEYEGIGKVKVFFDTTPYVKSQILIIKISFIIILISLLFSIIFGKHISAFAFKKLKKIAEEFKKIDIEKSFEIIKIEGNKDDEINILTETLNRSFCKIKCQTSNLKQFITDVSHEFKTPLMVINSQIDLYNKKLEKNVCDPNEARNILEKIKEKTFKLDKLLEIFLHLSRVENNIEILKKESVSLDSYLQEISLLYISGLNIDVDLQFNFQKNIEVDIEKGSFNILFENLLSNAIKFSPTGGDIEIGGDEHGFWVRDEGIGMDEKSIDQIWDKFYRNDTNKEGFGVGLFIVKRLVSMYEWSIKVESEKGKGTKFIIKF